MVSIPWVKVDDKFHSHPKVMELDLAAVGLWTLAATWCADYLTDGEIKKGQVRRLGGTDDHIDQLVESGLWEESGRGYRFTDWFDYQPSAESVKSDREAKSKAGAKTAHERWHVGRGVVSPDCELCNSSSYSSTYSSSNSSRVAPPVAPSSLPHAPEPVPLITPPSPDGEEDQDDGFDAFWANYPKKVNKGDARKAYTKALTKTQAHTIRDGAQGYADFCKNTGREKQYTKGPDRWLNVEGWANEDELDAPKQHKPSKWDLPPEAYMHPEEVEDERRRAEQQQRNSGAR